jgi:hypothetical protein
MTFPREEVDLDLTLPMPCKVQVEGVLGNLFQAPLPFTTMK